MKHVNRRSLVTLIKTGRKASSLTKRIIVRGHFKALIHQPSLIHNALFVSKVRRASVEQHFVIHHLSPARQLLLLVSLLLLLLTLTSFVTSIAIQSPPDWERDTADWWFGFHGVPILKCLGNTLARQQYHTYIIRKGRDIRPWMNCKEGPLSES